MIANREMTEEEFELAVLMYVQEEPKMYPLNKARELFNLGIFQSSGQFGLVENSKNLQRGECVYGVTLSQRGIDLVDQADPVEVVRIWIDHDFIVAATGWIRSKMSRDQLPVFLSHKSQAIGEAAFSRLRDLEQRS